MENKGKRLWKIFISTLYLSAFTFGGGYVIVTLMKKKFVDELGWIDENEMLDLVAIAQSAPGAIAVNGAIVVGYKLEGLIGALTAIVGTIIPPFAIISVISFFYAAFSSNFIVKTILDGMQSGVAAVIAAVVWDMGSGIVRGKNKMSLTIMAAAFLATAVFNVNVVYVVLICIALGVVRTVVRMREGKRMIYWQLFLSFLQIGMFSFGGGYAALPLIQEQVMKHGWLSATEFTDLITISQMTPVPDCSQFGNLCGNPHWRGAGGTGCNIWMYFTVVHSCYGAGMAVSALPQTEYASERAGNTASGGGSDDRGSGRIDYDNGILEWSGRSGCGKN